MPDLESIRAAWDSPEGWQAGGDEWSGPWGGTEMLWWSVLMPRIHGFLPAGVILELGPGQGRWSQFLVERCERLVLVDVADHALEACRERLAGAVELHVGDGRSLPMLADGSVDFCFSFDSLVHAENDVLEGYAAELARVLSPDGVAFLHMSNMGAHTRGAAVARRVPGRARRWLVRAGVLPNTYAWRAETTTGAGFAGICEAAGLSCIGLELIAWQYGRHLTDALVTVTRPGSRRDRPMEVARNRRFVATEAGTARRLARLYAFTSQAG